MNYRKTYSKLIKLGKDMTPEGSNARNKAILIKDKKLDDIDHRKTRKRNHGYDKGGITGNQETWENLDKIIRDGNFYNYHYILIKQIKMSEPSRMDSTYIPLMHIPSCPDCNLPNIDREPLLQKSTGIRWYCWLCKEYFVQGSDGKLRKIENTETETDEKSKLSELEKLMKKKFGSGGQHKGKTIIGPGGIPNQPKKAVTKINYIPGRNNIKKFNCICKGSWLGYCFLCNPELKLYKDPELLK